jgi:hypothetical protein
VLDDRGWPRTVVVEGDGLGESRKDFRNPD